ncbi:MAG TPA: hypothetical protein VNX21_08840, partial [Candidatus Thermoplasmatota archaeon]|nr:hypothetical protein [Candidatus Thermoplasmatota archaeon]
MLPDGAEAKAVATLVSAAFAFVILAAGGRRPAERALAGFFLLIAGNQGAETARALAASPEAGLAWFRLATAFAALDPVALCLFAALLAPGDLAARRAQMAVVAAVGVGFAVLAAWMHPPQTPHAGMALANA